MKLDEEFFQRIGIGLMITVLMVLMVAIIGGLLWLAVWALGWWCLLALPLAVTGYCVGTLVFADGDIERFKKQVRKDFPFLYRNDLSL